MPIVDEARLTGNAGVARVAAILSNRCLVRPVSADTDVGIDLFCEALQGDLPFLHFWIQVKSGATQVHVSANDDWASCRFDRDHLDYWSRQPVPVFGALVPHPDQPDGEVYLCNISEDIMLRGIPQTEGRSIRSSLTLRPAEAESLNRFLAGSLAVSSARWQCHLHGVVENIPTLQAQYLRAFPPLPVIRYQQVITEQVRLTAAFTIIQAFAQGQIRLLDTQRRRILGRVAEMNDFNHWENPMAAGLSRHCDQEYEDAQTYYNAALDCIRRDPHVAEAEFRTRNERILGVLIECSADNLELEEAQARFDPRRIQGDL